MLTLRGKNYTPADYANLYVILQNALLKLGETEECKSHPDCDHCAYKTVCNDIDSLMEYCYGKGANK